MSAWGFAGNCGKDVNKHRLVSRIQLFKFPSITFLHLSVCSGYCCILTGLEESALTSELNLLIPVAVKVAGSPTLRAL